MLNKKLCWVKATPTAALSSSKSSLPAKRVIYRFVERWVADGVYEFDAGDYKKSGINFKKVLLFRKLIPAFLSAIRN